MTFEQVQQEAEDAVLAGLAVAASTISLELPRTTPIRSPLAPRPRATVAVADSDASGDPLVYDGYQTPTTHRVVATLTVLLGIPFMDICGKENRTFRSLRVIGIAAADRLKTTRS
jgi:hypothetical protein